MSARPVEWSAEAVSDALELIETRSLDAVELFFGDAMQTVAGCLRGLFTAAPGHDLICSDYSAIEAVVIAALAGEQWRLDVLAAKRDIYYESVARITGMTYGELLAWKAANKAHHPLRQSIGKPAELGLGFGGWIGAWKTFGGPGTDEEIKTNILAWRAASPAIVHFWGGQRRDWKPSLHGLEGAAILACQHPGERWDVVRLDGTTCGVSYISRGDVLYCQLPSGRYLTYHQPRLEQSPDAWRGLAFSYSGWNTNPKSGPPGWVRLNAYGGKFAENVVQAVARDIQRHAIVNLEKRGYPVVLHVYDEDVSEVPEGFGSIEEFESIMNTMPAWAEGWPIRATGGWRGKRYRKG